MIENIDNIKKFIQDKYKVIIWHDDYPNIDNIAYNLYYNFHLINKSVIIHHFSYFINYDKDTIPFYDEAKSILRKIKIYKLKN